jgi:hypothetical protein
MSFSEDLVFFSDVIKYEYRGKSREEMAFLYKKVFELALRASEEEYPVYNNVTQEVHGIVLDALTLAELILHENDPKLKNPETLRTFEETIRFLEPAEFGISLEEDFDSRVEQNGKWIYSYLWDMNHYLEEWISTLA